MPLVVSEVRVLSELSEQERDWDLLVAEAPEGDLFQTSEWVTTWLQSFWPKTPLHFLFVRDGSRLVGLAPLLPAGDSGLWCRQSLVTPVNNHGMRTGLLSAAKPPSVQEALLEHLVRNAQNAPIAFKRVLADSEVLRELKTAVVRYGRRSLLMEEPAAPYVDLAMGWEAYCRERSSHVLHEVARKRRRLEKLGTVEVSVVTRAGECDAAYRKVIEIEQNCWKAINGNAISSSDVLRQFYGRLMQRLAKGGMLRTYLLSVDGRAVAYLYGAVFRGHYYAIKTSYHSTYRQYAPGAYLFWAALQDAFSLRIERFEMLGEQERWKRELATGSVPQVDLCLYPTVRPGCGLCHLARGRIKPFLKRKAPLLVRARHVLQSRSRRRADREHKTRG